jgi:hypothetical protein
MISYAGWCQATAFQELDLNKAEQQVKIQGGSYMTGTNCDLFTHS